MVSLVPSISYQPFLEAFITPVKLVVSVFLKAVSFFLDTFGAREWARSLEHRAKKIDCGAIALFEGLWNYGFRFKVISENAIESCRGSSYWFIHQLFLGKDIMEIAKEFEDGPPQMAIGMQKDPNPPTSIQEECVLSIETVDQWPLFPKLDPGIYTILLGYSENVSRPKKGHRVVLLNFETPILFDPSTGLSIWKKSDWKSFLDRKSSVIRTSNAGYFTIAIYSYQKNLT